MGSKPDMMYIAGSGALVGKKTLIKYDFSNINELVEKPPKKSIWKSLIMKAVECYWAKKIREIATWYPSLERLNSEIYKPKLYHPIDRIIFIVHNFPLRP
jgi:hypothetical protein